MTWLQSAACQGLDVAWWYPDPVRRGYRPAAPGVAICRSCPVRLSCLDHAVRAGEEYGVWGGLTPEQRDHHKHQRVATAARLREVLSEVAS